MSGSANYNNLDHTRSIDPRNISAGRSSVIGTLIHTTSGINSLNWLLVGSANSGNPASADYLVDKDGTRHKLCPDGYYPYHAGQSRLIYNGLLYEGDEISSMLLGVELECIDDGYVTFSQFDSLAELIVERGLHYGWRWPYYLLGHYEVARPLARRSDPQGFPWGDFMGRLYVRASANNIAGL